jgi:hypothetical protein
MPARRYAAAVCTGGRRWYWYSFARIRLFASCRGSAGAAARGRRLERGRPGLGHGPCRACLGRIRPFGRWVRWTGSGGAGSALGHRDTGTGPGGRPAASWPGQDERPAAVPRPPEPCVAGPRSVVVRPGHGAGLPAVLGPREPIGTGRRGRVRWRRSREQYPSGLGFIRMNRWPPGNVLDV